VTQFSAGFRDPGDAPIFQFPGACPRCAPFPSVFSGTAFSDLTHLILIWKVTFFPVTQILPSPPRHVPRVFNSSDAFGAFFPPDGSPRLDIQPFLTTPDFLGRPESTQFCPKRIFVLRSPRSTSSCRCARRQKRMLSQSFQISPPVPVLGIYLVCNCLENPQPSGSFELVLLAPPCTSASAVTCPEDKTSVEPLESAPRIFALLSVLGSLVPHFLLGFFFFFPVGAARGFSFRTVRRRGDSFLHAGRPFFFFFSCWSCPSCLQLWPFPPGLSGVSLDSAIFLVAEELRFLTY